MTDPSPSAPVAPRSRVNRWLAIGLIVSVAFNLAFIGWGAVRFAKFHRMASHPSRHIEERIANHLPDNAAMAFRQAMQRNRKDETVSFRQLGRETADALAAEPYDRARLETLLNEHRSRLDNFQQSLQAGLLAAADSMTPEQRKEYAEHLRRHGPRDRRR